MFKKILCGLLASVMLTALLTSCQTGGDGNETESQTSQSTTESSSDSDETTGPQLGLPDNLYFNDEKVVFLTRDASEWSTYDIYSEGSGASALSESVFKRNELVRNRLGVTIKEMKEDDATILQKVQQTASSNLNDFQAVVSRSLEASSMAVSGYLRDLNSHTVNHLDLSQEWWDQNITKELSMDGHLYYTTGDIVTTDNDATFCILFNKTMAADSKLPDLYQLVKKGEWTMDRMLEFMDTVAGNSSGADRTYGLLYTEGTTFSIYYGAGIKTVGKDLDTDTFAAALDVKLADNVADKAKLIFSNSLALNLVKETESTGETLMSLGQKYFGGGKALFYGDVLQCVERMRPYDVVFGVLPYPMYDTNQSSYHHMMHLEGAVISIPRSGKIQGNELDKIAATMEAMAYYSMDTVTKQYYDINLTSKNVHDAESGPMIDLILSTRVYDLAYYFDLAPNNGNVTHKLASCMTPDSNTSVASFYRSYSNLIGKRIQAVINSMNKQSSLYGE